MAITANTLSGFLQVYAYKSLPAFVSDLPPRSMFVENFDDSIANEGTAVVTRIPTTSFSSSPNNLASGWADQTVTSSAITATLLTKGYDYAFNITEWSTVGEQQLLNTFGNVLAKQVANAIGVDVMSNVTNSYYTNTLTVTSGSLFALTGSNSLQAGATLLDNLEIPQAERYAILTPNTYQALISNLYQQYVYGSQQVVMNNGFKDLDGKDINSTNPGLKVSGIEVFKYARLNNNTAKLPYGGPVVSTTGVVGFIGNKSGLVLASRTPVPLTAPASESYTVVDPTSGFPLQFSIVFDPSYPGWRVACYSLWGSAKGNSNAIVPIQSTVGY